MGRSLELPQQLIHAPDYLLSPFHANQSQALQMHGALRSCHSLAVYLDTLAGCDSSIHLNRSPSSSRHSEKYRMVRIVGEERMTKREWRAGCGRLVDGLHRHWRDCCGACPWSTIAQYGEDMLMTSSRYCAVQYMMRKANIVPTDVTCRQTVPQFESVSRRRPINFSRNDFIDFTDFSPFYFLDTFSFHYRTIWL